MTSPTSEQASVAGRRSPAVAAALSALWPGLGQWYAGNRRAAALQGLLPLLLMAVMAVLLFARGPEGALVLLLQPAISLSILGAVVLLLAWRLGSMFHARRLADRGASTGQRRAGLIVLFLTAVTVVTVHAYVARFPLSFYEFSAAAFVPGSGGGPIGLGPTPGPAGSPGASLPPGATPEPGATATPQATTGPGVATPPPSDRINILFIGIDASPVREESHRLTDTILLASFDPVENRVEMISLPRDTARFPLFDEPDTEFDGKINELMGYADARPERYPQGGIAALIGEMEYLVGVDIDHYASIEIPGFREMIDAVGGVDVVNEQLIDDPEFNWDDGRVGYYLEPGPYHLDGENALAYVRSRKGRGNTDLHRARRQQQVLLALRQKLSDPTVLARLPDILSVASRTVRTDLPAEQLGSFMEIARQTGGARVKSVVLGPDEYSTQIPAVEINGQYALKLDLDAVAQLSVRLFGPDSRYWNGTAGRSPVN